MDPFPGACMLTMCAEQLAAWGQSHAFHLACTTVLGLAAYQAVIALARNSEGFDFWGGVLMTGANATLLFPMLAIPIIFGGLRSRRLRDLSPPEEQQVGISSSVCPTSAMPNTGLALSLLIEISY